MAKRDYYEVLGIQKGADKKEIKSAYRKMAKELHPDRNKAEDAEEKFKEVQEAYEVLSDDNKRHAYDQYGHAGTSGFGGAGFGGGFNQAGFDFSGAGMDFGSIEDIFEQFFGGGFGGGMRNRPRRGQDIGVRISVTFKEAVFGVEKEISYKRGFPEEGEKSETMKIKVPGGIPDNAMLRFQGKGHGGFNGGPPGDLLINIEVEVDDRFERRGSDIYIDSEIDIYTAVLGGTLDVPTVHGDSTLKIPEGIQSETVLKLKEKGGPKLRGKGNGDQYVRVIVKTPTKLSKAQKKAWEELASLPDTKDGIIGKIFG